MSNSCEEMPGEFANGWTALRSWSAPTEFADDFIDVAVIRNGPDFQHAGQRELQFAIASVLAGVCR